MKLITSFQHSLALHLESVPGVCFAYTEKPWRLWLVKSHAHFEENRPLSPTLDSAGALKRFVAEHAPYLQQQAVDAAAAGFDHGAGTLLPDPPHHEPEPDLTRVGWRDRHALLQQIQETARRPPVKVTVDLRHLELLGGDGIEANFLAGSFLSDADDAYELTLGPLQMLLELDQVGEILHALLETYVGDFAPVLMTILDRLPEGTSNDYRSAEDGETWDRVVGALWLAVDSYRDLWPLRRGGYDDAVWNLTPPPNGVTVHRPLPEEEYYRPPRFGMYVDDLRANLRALLRRRPRVATPPAQDAPVPQTTNVAARRERILLHLQDTPGMRYTALEVADGLGLDYRLVERDLTALVKAGRVRHERNGVPPARSGGWKAHFWVEAEP